MAEQADTVPRPSIPTYGNRTIEISKNSDLTISVLGSKNDRGERYLTYFKVEAKALTTNSNTSLPLCASIRLMPTRRSSSKMLI